MNLKTILAAALVAMTTAAASATWMDLSIYGSPDDPWTDFRIQQHVDAAKVNAKKIAELKSAYVQSWELAKEDKDDALRATVKEERERAVLERARLLSENFLLYSNCGERTEPKNLQDILSCLTHSDASWPRDSRVFWPENIMVHGIALPGARPPVVIMNPCYTGSFVLSKYQKSAPPMFEDCTSLKSALSVRLDVVNAGLAHHAVFLRPVAETWGRQGRMTAVTAQQARDIADVKGLVFEREWINELLEACRGNDSVWRDLENLLPVPPALFDKATAL